jgi:predicted Rossmann fold flavoprotein
MQKKIIIIGAGASGMLSAIIASRNNHKVILLEKLPKIGAKLRATGGGRCNLANTLSNQDFMAKFGRDGRFMTPALQAFSYQKVQAFFNDIGVNTHAPDGFRIFPVGHNASTIIKALQDEMNRFKIEVFTSQKVEYVEHNNKSVTAVVTQDRTFFADSVIVATGGMGYPMLGAEGDGYRLAQSVGHKITSLHPAMMPLKTKESWMANCRADTIAKVEMRVDIKKYKKLSAKGDLIFTKNGVRGPVVLDFSREITPLLSKFKEVPILINMTKGMNQEQIREHFKSEIKKNNNHTTKTLIETLLPSSVTLELCKIANANPDLTLNRLSGIVRDRLIQLLVWTPLTISGHDGFKMAMITRGGVSLKEIDPNSMRSKKMDNLYFSGEVLNLDGPCGGYNLQWAFSSGFLAGFSL